MISDKVRVRHAFGAAADSYDATASFQRDVGIQLLAALPPVDRPRRILDAGCGTGHGLALLAGCWPDAELLALDFALPMLKRLRHERSGDSILSCCGDVEAVPFADSTFDLIWSNLTLQWCDPVLFVREAARLLRPGGVVAASTLGPGTFTELRSAFAGADSYRHTTLFRHADEVVDAIASAGLRLRMRRQATTIRYHAEMRTLLAEVRDIGANRIVGNGQWRRTGLMGKAAWRRFEQGCENQRTPDGLPLSYETLLICAEK